MDRFLPLLRQRWAYCRPRLWILAEGSEPEIPQKAVVSSSVDWDLARRVAAKVGGKDPFADSKLAESLEPDLLPMTAQAEELVAIETGLPSLSGVAKAKVTDRAGWVDANLASFERLMRPLLGKIEDEANQESPSRLGRLVDSVTDPLAEAVGPRAAGVQLGSLLGWMSGRVIGQYDLLIAEDDNPQDQDWVYYVGPNVLGLEKSYGFPPKEFRLWIALHECTHRAQFTGVPWLRPHFLSLVNELLDTVDTDGEQLTETLKRLVDSKRSGSGDGSASGSSGSLRDGGISSLLASPEQKATLDKMTGLMSLLEGHGDITMDRAGAGLIPSQPRFARVMSQRRKSAKGLNKIIQRVLGFEAKLAQYEEGEKFVHALEAAGGRELFDQVWTGPEMLPSIDEIRSPDLWIARAGAKPVVSTL